MALPVLDSTHSTASERQSRSTLCAMTVMAKAPRAGRVKTRLSPPLTSEQAAALNICFLRDTTHNLASIPNAAGVISYTPIGDEALFEGHLPPGFALIPQREGDFGQRLLGAAQDILACGFASICLIDSDSPTVPTGAYAQAAAHLARPGDRIVLGPTADGGYYLIGLKRAHPEVFGRIAWSTDAVFSQTLARAREAGIEVVELPLWYDVDDGPTLDLLRAELLAGIGPGFALSPGYAAVHTRAMLLQIDPSLNAETRLDPRAGGAADEPLDASMRPLP